MPEQSAHLILWKRLDERGHEAARLSLEPSAAAGFPGWRLAGAATFAYEGSKPCLLAYRISAVADWRTTAATVTGWVGDLSVEIHLARDDSDHWTLNGASYPAVDGCVDLDLNFSPSTNLLPIRRLGLAIGQSAEVRAAWLRFPSFSLEPLPQVYHRTGELTYRYEASGGAFTADLTVNAAGFITRYPNFWVADLGA